MSRQLSTILAIAAALAASAVPALASSSEWVATRGGQVRLVTSGSPDAQGLLKGALEIALQPGWKTYWRDPGDAGVPPTLDVSRSANVRAAELDFPVPERHDEGEFVWAGYARPVTFAVRLHAADAGAPMQVDADVFLGICQTICLPVQATLQVDPAADADNADDADLVREAFAALPPPPSADFTVTHAAREGAMLAVEAKLPGDPAKAQLFLAGTDEYTFSAPRRDDREGKVRFVFDMTAPDHPPAGEGLHYTLVGENGAVSGLLPFP